MCVNTHNKYQALRILDIVPGEDDDGKRVRATAVDCGAVECVSGKRMQHLRVEKMPESRRGERHAQEEVRSDVDAAKRMLSLQSSAHSSSDQCLALGSVWTDFRKQVMIRFLSRIRSALSR